MEEQKRSVNPVTTPTKNFSQTKEPFPNPSFKKITSSEQTQKTIPQTSAKKISSSNIPKNQNSLANTKKNPLDKNSKIPKQGNNPPKRIIKKVVKKKIAPEKKQPAFPPKGIPDKNVGYKYVGKERIKLFIKENISKEMIPTNKTGYILGFVFLLVVIIALIQFPLNEMLAGEVNVTVSVGIPMPLLEFHALDPLQTPIKFKGFIIDLIIYLFISYIIDVIINLTQSLKLIKKKEKLNKHPKIFKDVGKSNISERITNKTFENKKEGVKKEDFKNKNSLANTKTNPQKTGPENKQITKKPQTAINPLPQKSSSIVPKTKSPSPSSTPQKMPSKQNSVVPKMPQKPATPVKQIPLKD